MYSRFLYYLLQLRFFLIFSLLGSIVVLPMLLLQMKEFRFSERYRLLFISLFFEMPFRYMVYLAANWLQLCFVISMLMTMASVELSHLILLVLLGLLQALSVGRILESIRSFLGSVLLYGALLMVELLHSYLSDLRFDWRIAFVFLLTCIFLVLYSLYFFINSIKCLAEGNVAYEPALLKAIRRIKGPEEEAGIIDLDLVDLEELEEKTFEEVQ